MSKIIRVTVTLMDDDGITHHGVGGCYTEAIDEIRKLIAANKDRGIDFSRCK